LPHLSPPSVLSHVLSVLFVCLWSAASVVTPARGSDVSERQERLNGGYYLLHHLCEDEAKLPLLLAVKHTPPETVDFVDRISKTAKESLTALEHMQKGDETLQFDKNPLPPIERDVRESIQDEKQHQLLFGTTDAEFVRALLVSQIEASSYALNLAKVLSEQEKDPDRVKSLDHISAKWLAVRNEAYRLLRN
jgi:hypothetical protein